MAYFGPAYPYGSLYLPPRFPGHDPQSYQPAFQATTPYYDSPPALPGKPVPHSAAHSGNVEVSIFELAHVKDPKWCIAPSIILELARQHHETKVTPYNQRPTWDQSFVFRHVKVNDHMYVAVRDAGKRTVVASGKVSGSSIVSKAPKKFWVSLKDSSSVVVAKLLVGVRDVNAPDNASTFHGMPGVVPRQDHKPGLRRSQSMPTMGTSQGGRSTNRSLAGVSDDGEARKLKTQTVQVVRASDLPMSRPNRNNNAYAEVKVGRSKQQTSTKQHQGSVVWGDILHFSAPDDAEMTVRIIDSTNGRGALVGTCIVLLADLQKLTNKQMLEVDLADSEGRPAGNVVLRGPKTRAGGFPKPRRARTRSPVSRTTSPIPPPSGIRNPSTSPSEHTPRDFAVPAKRPVPSMDEGMRGRQAQPGHYYAAAASAGGGSSLAPYYSEGYHVPYYADSVVPVTADSYHRPVVYQRPASYMVSPAYDGPTYSGTYPPYSAVGYPVYGTPSYSSAERPVEIIPSEDVVIVRQ